MIVGIVVVLAIFIGMVATRSYEKEVFSTITKKEHKLQFLYPLGLFLAMKIFLRKKEQRIAKKEELRYVNVTADIQQVFKIYQAKRMALILFVLLIVSFFYLCLMVSGQEPSQVINGNYIERPNYGEDEKTVALHIQAKSQDVLLEDDMVVTIGPRKYTEEEFDQEIVKAREYLNQVMCGENTSLDGVYYPLTLPTYVPESGLEIRWLLDDENLVNNDGSLNQLGLIEPKKVTLQANIVADNFRVTQRFDCTILPLDLTKEELAFYGIEKEIVQTEVETGNEEKIALPKKLMDMDISYEERVQNKAFIVLILGGIVSVLLYFIADSKLRKQRELRDEQCMLDYPDIVNKFTLLLGAGMTMKRAWGKIVSDYKEAQQKKGSEIHYAYEELAVSWYELSNGVNECRAYESFGRRMKLLPYMKFSSILTQNAAKGMDGMFYVLQKEAMEAFEERKEIAKRLGERAGTKLLGPMMLMLGIVLIMILVPAVSNF